MTKAIVIAGTNSGVGKTTIATGLMGALAAHGLKVQPFKAGPDYIDPSYHSQVTGRPSRNLDTWMLPAEAVIELFQRAMTGNDIAVIEGVMGLYDGRKAIGDAGSTAELAKLLGAPVLLVVDSRKGGRSTAAIVGGYRDFDPDLQFAGVILNDIGSSGHLELCLQAIEHYTGLPVLGYLQRDENLTLPERHLGLVPTAEGQMDKDFLSRLVSVCQQGFDIPRILQSAACRQLPPAAPRLFPLSPVEDVVRLGVARDRAFSFYYQDNLDLLTAWGARLAPFSLLDDAALPPDIDGIYLGGGFPELYAAGLAANQAMKRQIKAAAASGMPVYAECGGLMYLGHSINDFEGREHAMVGAVPVTSQIDGRRLSLGYRTIEALGDGPVLQRGQTVRGHEFHWSRLKSGIETANAYRVLEKDGAREGFQDNRLLASYIHLHFGACPQLAPQFVANCKEYSEQRRK